MALVPSWVLAEVVVIAEVVIASHTEGLVHANTNELRKNAGIAPKDDVRPVIAESLASKVRLTHVAQQHVFEQLPWCLEGRALVLSVSKNKWDLKCPKDHEKEEERFQKPEVGYNAEAKPVHGVLARLKHEHVIVLLCVEKRLALGIGSVGLRPVGKSLAVHPRAFFLRVRASQLHLLLVGFAEASLKARQRREDLRQS